MADPVERRFRHLKDRPSFYFAVIFVAVAVILSGYTQYQVFRESKDRTSQLQDVICGVYVPIGKIPLTVKSTPQLKTIVAATRHGALRINCPGAKP